MLKGTILSAFPDTLVLEAPDSDRALKQVLDNRPGLAFVDILMPGGNGLELTKQIKSSHPDVKVVILTNHDTLEHREAAKACGADDFLAKSTVSPRDIEAAVKAFMPRDQPG
jgi:DNA-binding NarL/FixJ family response regulator